MKTWTWFLLGIGIIGLGVGAFNTASGRLPWDFTDDAPVMETPPTSPGAAVDAPFVPKPSTWGTYNPIPEPKPNIRPGVERIILEV